MPDSPDVQDEQSVIRPASIPLLWVSGAPGVGKSTAAWALYQRLIARGHRVCYVDVDQLGIVLPSPSGDPERHRLKLRNVIEVARNFRASGAEQAIVSGIVDPDRATGRRRFLAAGLDLTLVRLTSTAEALTRRYLERGSTPDRLHESLSIAATLDRKGIGLPVETTARSPSAVVDALEALIRLRNTGEPPAPSHPAAPLPRPCPRVILLTGATAVGKSSVGWHVFRSLAGSGTTTGFVDIDQLAFHPGRCPALTTANFVSVISGFRSGGADVVVAVARAGPEEGSAYRRALGGTTVTVAHLDAQPADVIERIAHRAAGDGPRLAGDLLLGASPAEQQVTAARAVTEAERARREQVADVISIDTSGRTATDVATELLGLVRSRPA
jgi:adenylylsulfate kinase-like enzyme